MKIIIYTITDCQFSKQEKEYLKSHNLVFEEKNLELNKEWLTEMLAISNNFAGTPVTFVEKDDGTIRVFKGFTKEEFDEFFGFSNQQDQTTPPQQSSQDQIDSKLNDVLDKLEEKTKEINNQNQKSDLNQIETNLPSPNQTEPPSEFINQNTTENQLQKEETKPETPSDSPPLNIPQIPDLPSDLKN